jgi:hypothetical protein
VWPGCRRLSAASLIAASLIAGAALLALADAAAAQTAPSPSILLRPAFDGDPSKPQQFDKPRSGAATTPTRFAPTRNARLRGAASSPRSLRIFATPPGSGAGTTGFVSTNARRQRAKAARNVARPAGPLSLSPAETQPASASARAGAVAEAPPATDIHPAAAAARAGAAIAGPAGDDAGRPGIRPRRPLVETDPFEPLGVRTGSFLLRPAIELTGGYDTNPERTTNGGGSSLGIVAPELLVRSDWQRHALNADLRGTYTAYGRDFVPALDRPFAESKVVGRIDVARDSRIDLENRVRVATDNPGSPNLQAGLAKLPIYTALGGTAGLAQRFNRMEVAVKGSVDRTVYQNSTLTDGSSSSNADRNFNQYAAVLRGSYEMTPGVIPFVEVGRDARRHDLAVDRTGTDRDSDGTTARIGTTYELTRLLTGEASIGYLIRTYKDPTLPDIGALIYDASLVWTASALTKVTLTAKSTVEETTLAGVSGTLKRDVVLQVEHAFRRWLTGMLRLGFGNDDYIGSTRDDDRYLASAALIYKVTREVQIKGEFRHEWLKSTAVGVDYTANVYLLGLRLQR